MVSLGPREKRVRFGGLLPALLAIALLFVIALIPSAAGAAPQGNWILPAKKLTPGGQRADSPRITTAADGTATAVWRHRKGTTWIVQAATRPLGGAFGRPVNLSAIGQNAESPQVITAPDGTTTALWILNRGTIQTSTRPPGGVFGAPINISETSDFVGAQQITIAPDGTTIIVWIGVDNPGSPFTVETIRTSTRPPGGVFGAAVDLATAAPTERFEPPRIVAGPDSTISVFWGFGTLEYQIIRASTRPPGGVFGAPVNLSEVEVGRVDSGPEIAIAPDGTTTVIWTDYFIGGEVATIQASTRPPGGAFGTPVRITGSRLGFGSPALTTAPDGTTTIIWGRRQGDSDFIQAITRPPGGSFGSQVNLSRANQTSFGHEVTTAPDGTTTVIWIRRKGNTQTIEASTRRPGGAFGAQVRISAANGRATSCDITSAPDGSITAIWGRVSPNAKSRMIETASTGPPKASIRRVAVSGPGKTKRGRVTTYKVKITNSGSVRANKVRLTVSGRGIRFDMRVGKIGAGKSRIAKVRIRPRTEGRIRITFKVTSKNAGGKTVRKVVAVR